MIYKRQSSVVIRKNVIVLSRCRVPMFVCCFVFVATIVVAAIVVFCVVFSAAIVVATMVAAVRFVSRSQASSDRVGCSL